ncbi:MAG TPA: hypothetical protein VH369_21875 [Bryobacteraceae bacterium]
MVGLTGEMPMLHPGQFFGLLILFCSAGPGQQANSNTVSVPLRVAKGTPLRLYVTGRVRFNTNEPVKARLADPVWLFDRIVIPAGTPVSGHIVQLEPVSKMARAMAVTRGDFTPLKTALVSFDALRLAGRPTLPVVTEPSLGLASIYVPPPPGKKKPVKAPSNTKTAQARQLLKQQAISQANARSHGMLDFVRTRNKREWLIDFFWSKLPWHPQWYRSGTRFDAVLTKPLDMGEAQIPAAELSTIGSAPPPDRSVLLRLENGMTSADARVGDAVDGVLSEPLFNSAHQLVLPEGTRLHGRVTLARHARMFHRGGQLRFAFSSVEPESLPALAAFHQRSILAQLTAGEANSAMKVDEEGTAKATESKTRFLRPIVAGLVAAKSLDNDEGRSAASGGASANYGGRSLGGFSGFGLFGTALSFGPHYIGSAFGFYGLAWSVYSTVISRGREVTFEKNAALAIRFGTTGRRGN